MKNENGKFVFIGLPNAGKGSLKKNALKGREKYFDSLSVGDLLRKEKKHRPNLAKKQLLIWKLENLFLMKLFVELPLMDLKQLANQ